MIQKISRHWSFVIISLLLVGLLAWPMTSAVQAGKGGNSGGGGSTTFTTPNTFSGQATVVQANVLNLVNTTLVNAGPLSTSGGAEEASLLTVNVTNLLTAEVAH